MSRVGAHVSRVGAPVSRIGAPVARTEFLCPRAAIYCSPSLHLFDQYLAKSCLSIVG